MKKVDYFNQSFEEFLNIIVSKWKSNGFKYHFGHLKLLKYAYLVKVRWLLVFKQRMTATREFMKRFQKFAANMQPTKQLRLF